MARKSKTQRAKASANRAEKKEQALLAAQQPETVDVEPEPKKGLFQKKASTGVDTSKEKKAVKEEKPKKQRFKFFREVREEMKRVTWPTRKDVMRWSAVVVVALLFFGIYVAVLDEIIANALTQFASLTSIIGA